MASCVSPDSEKAFITALKNVESSSVSSHEIFDRPVKGWMTGTRGGDEGSGEDAGDSSLRSEWRNVKLIFDEPNLLRNNFRICANIPIWFKLPNKGWLPVFCALTILPTQRISQLLVSPEAPAWHWIPQGLHQVTSMLPSFLHSIRHNTTFSSNDGFVVTVHWLFHHKLDHYRIFHGKSH